jgi:hypothetical protein
MELETIPAYITVVTADRTIVLPDDMPIGAKVAVVIMPSERSLPNEDDARRERFAKTLAAIKAAVESEESLSAMPDDALDELIEKARKSTGT